MTDADSAKASSTAAGTAKKASALAVPLLGVMGAIQGSDPNIASTALVGANKGLDMGSLMALAASISTLTLSATVITTGLLADRLGRKMVLIVALIVGALGDLLVVAAANPSMFLVGRAIAGIGLGAVYGASFAYIRAVSRPGQLAGAMGLFTAVVALFTVIFSFIGGELAASSWRTAYLLIPIASLVCVPLVMLLLPKQQRITDGKVDYIGQALLIFGILSFLVGVSKLSKSLTSPEALIPIAIGAALLAGFFIFESKTGNPLYPVRLFKNPVFLAAIMAGLIYNLGVAVAYLQFANLWQYVTKVPLDQIAIWQLPLLSSGIVGALIFGKLMTRGMTAQTVILWGGIITGIGFLVAAFFGGAKSFWAFLPGLVLIGFGCLVASLPYGTLIIQESPPKFFGPVTSSRTTIGQFIYAIGLALSTVLIDKMTTGGVVAKLTAAGVPPSQVAQGLDAVTVYASKGTEPNTELGQRALSQAAASYTHAFGVTMAIFGVILVAAGVLGWWLLTRHSRRQAEGTGAGAPQPASA